MKILSDAFLEIEKTIEKTMAKINPITKKEIEKEIKSISTRAKSAWPIRQEKYGRSLKSRDKIQVSMGGNQTVIGQIKNAAPYAWAIKAGKNSKTTVAPGRRIAEELLFKPAKNSAKKIGAKIADAVLDNLRRT